MAKKEDKQPVVEGSTAENVTEGASGDGKDAAPAEKHEAATAAETSVAEKAPAAVAPAVESEPAINDDSKAAVEKMARLYGIPHAGDLHDTVRKLADILGHAKDEAKKDFVSLLAKLRAHTGI